jgi:hypothetical protein
MATAAQLAANRANAKKSTGPRTADGKAASAANATKDGFTAQSPIVPTGEEAQFDAFKVALLEDTHPEGALEQEFFERLLTYGWNLRRARAAESRVLARADFSDDADSDRLLRVARYRRDLERSHDRALRELRQLQTQRAILLQQEALVVEQFSSVAPLAEFSRLTTHTDPMISGFNGCFYRPVALHATRAQARQTLAERKARNEANPDPQSEESLLSTLADRRTTNDERDQIMDRLTFAPEA